MTGLLPAVRFVLGIVIGAALWCSNVYLGLKLGFTFGTAILAIFCWAGVMRVAEWLWSAKSLPPAEFVCLQSLASSLSYAPGTMIATALAALLIADKTPSSIPAVIIWAASVAGLGTCLAIPMRQRLIRDLRFPSSHVAAEAIQKLGRGQGARPFFLTIAISWLWIGIQQVWPFLQKLPLAVSRFSLQLSPMLIGLGALLGLRTCAAMLAGGLFFFGVLPQLPQPELQSTRGMWFAIAMMASASLYDFLRGIRMRSERSFSSNGEHSWWWKAAIGFAILAFIGQSLAFGCKPASLVITALTMIPAAIIAVRVTGETDVIPTGSIAKLHLLATGSLQPANYAANMSGTGTTATCAGATTDAAINFKTGLLLDVPFLRQFRYQLAGALMGPIIFLPLFFALIEGPWELGGDQLPAPAARIWNGVLNIAGGATQLPPDQQLAVLIGVAAGLVLTFTIRSFSLERWLPAPVPFAMAAVLDGPTVLTLFAGALLARLWKSSTAFAIWCAMIAAESAAMIAILLF